MGTLPTSTNGHLWPVLDILPTHSRCIATYSSTAETTYPTNSNFNILWEISHLDFKDLDELQECDGPTKLCAMSMGVCCLFAWFYFAEHLFTASILWGHICRNDVLTSSLTDWNIQWTGFLLERENKGQRLYLVMDPKPYWYKGNVLKLMLEFENRKKMK